MTIQSLTGQEYEEVVAKVVAQLELFDSGKVFRNRQFPGKTQPGSYEIDIALEVSFQQVIDFLLIIECKNWKRPVDRPVVQKLCQTKEAIGAHKAAIASPVGFTDEARQVASVKGVALWLIRPGDDLPKTILASKIPPTATEMVERALSEVQSRIKMLPDAKE